MDERRQRLRIFRREKMFRRLGLIGISVFLAMSSAGCQLRTGNGTEAAPADPVAAPTVAETRTDRDTDADTATPAELAAESTEDVVAVTDEGFASNAFPPTLPDTEWHRKGWMKNDCLRCHETGVEGAPRVVHRGMPETFLRAECRSCHVLIPGSKPREKAPPGPTEGDLFAANAFPPMIPNSNSHLQTWRRDDCLLCHDSGIKGAPVVEHAGLPRTLLKVKCRSCHVQVRADEASEPW